MGFRVLGLFSTIYALDKGDACNIKSDCPGDFPCLYNVETYEVRVNTPDRTTWHLTETINGKEYKKTEKWTKDEVEKIMQNGGVAVKDRPCQDFFEPPETLRCICNDEKEVSGGGNMTHPDNSGSDTAGNVSSVLWSIIKAILSFLLLLAIIGLILFCLYAKRDSIFAMFNKLESSSGHVDTRGNSSAKTMPTDKSKIAKPPKKPSSRAKSSRRKTRKSAI